VLIHHTLATMTLRHCSAGCRALTELPDALHALSTRLLQGVGQCGVSIPDDFLYGALRTTQSLDVLITALNVPRNDAFRVVQACVAVAAAVGDITFRTALTSEQPPAALLTDRTQLRSTTAIMVIDVLRNLLTSCRPPQVFTAAAPPQQLLPLLHAAAGTTLEALEAGALIWSPLLFWATGLWQQYNRWPLH
jgi:hypothetical protein